MTPFTYAFAKAGQHERALEEVESFEQMVHETTGPHGIVFAVLGMRDRAVATLIDEALQEFSPIRMAELAAALDEKTLALTILEREAENEVPFELLFMHCSEELRSLSGNPRYERVLDRVGFPD